MFWIAYRTLRARPWLAALSILAIALAVGLAVSVPVFAQAVSRAIMEKDLSALAEKIGRSPLAVRVYLLPSSQGRITAKQSRDVAGQIAGIYQRNLGIPVMSQQVTLESGGLMLMPGPGDPKPDTLLGETALGFLTNIENHIKVASGQPIGAASTGDAINVWMHESWAMEMGIQAGTVFIVQPVLQQVPIKVRIAGTWLPDEARDPFWPSDPNTMLRTVLVVLPDEYTARIEPLLGPAAVGSVSWAVDLSEGRFVPELAERYVKGFKRAEVQIQQMLPGARVDVSPVPALEAFLVRRRPLTLLLFSFSVPIIGFLLYFLALVSNILVDGQRQVTAIMVSRGVGPDQILRIGLLQSAILLVVGTPFGVLLGLAVARLMGHTSSFMQFVTGSAMRVSLMGVNVWLILATMAVSLLTGLGPIIRQGRLSIVDYTREAVRPEPSFFWQRFYLDLILIIPTAYAYRQLKQQGTIALLGWKSSGDIFRDPLLFLVPALFILTASLLFARLFPLLLRLADRFLSQHLGLVGCLTIRQLGRQGKQYVTPLLLIMASLSLGVFMASMAASLDGWLEDRMHYRLGADVVFQVEQGSSGAGEAGEGVPEPAEAATGDDELAGLGPDTELVPLQNLLRVRGIVAATWVGNYRAELPMTPDNTVTGRFLAIDRSTFPASAAFRPDFAPASLGDLMNRLAVRPDGVLVSREFLAGGNRSIGDELNLKLSLDAASDVEVHAVIVGAYDYFPTVYEEETPAVVGNLDHLVDVVGGVSTYQVWLRTDPARVQLETLKRDLTAAVPYFTHFEEVRTLIDEERDKKERIGVYGTLTIGFLACLALAGTGLLIQYHKSLQERLFRFATLRAIGLSRPQLIAEVQLEYLVVLAVGLAAGVLIGVEASRLFIPFFRVSTPDGRLPLPPLALLLDRQSITVMVATFGLIQVLAQGGLIRGAMRAELSRVLRMGSQE